MSFETGTASGPEDLMDKLEAFILSVSPTFTIDRAMSAASPFDLSVSDGDGLFCQISSFGDTDALYMAGSTGFDGSGWGFEPGSNTQAGGAKTSGHEVSEMTGPYEAYFFYMNFDPAIGAKYVHVVVETTAGVYRHFGFGTIDKVGSFVGGQYINGHFWQQGSQSDNPNTSGHRVAFDGIGTTGSTNRCHVHVPLDELNGWNGGLSSPAEKWHVAGNQSTGNDADGVHKGNIEWGGRQAWYLHPFFEIGGSSQFNGFKPLIPIPLFLRDFDPNPDEMYLLGYAPDVREISVEGLTPGQSLVIGGDTWDTFPVGRKYLVQDDTEGTGMWGRAYRRRV